MNKEEQFWQGQFGDDYTARNINFVENNYRMFHRIFEQIIIDIDDEHWQEDISYNIKSIIEFGAGSGQNIQALQRIFQNALFMAVEINDKAIEELRKIKNCNIYHSSILNYTDITQYDLVLSKGLLIHIHPDNIKRAYDVLYRISKKYILLCEYFNPTPIEVNYRGNTGKLWKRDFCKDMLNTYSDLKLIDYGFVYHTDGQDDITWWLLSK